jgi:hypothetical protein
MHQKCWHLVTCFDCQMLIVNRASSESNVTLLPIRPQTQISESVCCTDNLLQSLQAEECAHLCYSMVITLPELWVIRFSQYWFWGPVHVLVGLLIDLCAGNGRVCGIAIWGEECDSGYEVSVLTVDKTKMSEEVCTVDADLYVSHHSALGEVTA